MKICLFSLTLVSGLGYDIENVSVVTDSTFIEKIEQENYRHHKFEYCDAYLNSGQWKRTITNDTFQNCPKTTECRESRFDRSSYLGSSKELGFIKYFVKNIKPCSASIWDSQVPCGIHYFTPTDVRSCLSGVNFHMFGDSRTRQLFFALKALAQGQFNLTDIGGHVNTKYDENGLNIRYSWSPKLEHSKPFYPKLLKQLENEENPTKNWIYMMNYKAGFW